MKFIGYLSLIFEIIAVSLSWYFFDIKLAIVITILVIAGILNMINSVLMGFSLENQNRDEFV